MPRLPVLLALLTACSTPQPPLESDLPDITARVTGVIGTDSLNAPVAEGIPTVDVGMYLLDTASPTYNRRMPVAEVTRRYRLARDVFAGSGVRLNLMWIKTVEVTPEVIAIESNVMAGTPAGDISNLYEKSRQQKSTLSPEAEAVFEAIIEEDPANDRTVYLVGMERVVMNWFEQQEDGSWALQSDPTNALSFPSYTLEDRIPRRIRGVITLQNIFKSEKIVAHELGHKLINVSHEYRDISPQHEVDAEGGLMVYGEGLDIPSGEDGRFHLERLQRSPYLYRMRPDGTREYNEDYAEGGHYADPIYDGLVVRD